MLVGAAGREQGETVMWPLGSAMHTQKCDVACGKESGDLLETLLGILPLQ